MIATISEWVIHKSFDNISLFSSDCFYRVPDHWSPFSILNGKRKRTSEISCKNFTKQLAFLFIVGGIEKKRRNSGDYLAFPPTRYITLLNVYLQDMRINAYFNGLLLLLSCNRKEKYLYICVRNRRGEMMERRDIKLVYLFSFCVYDFSETSDLFRVWKIPVVNW